MEGTDIQTTILDTKFENVSNLFGNPTALALFAGEMSLDKLSTFSSNDLLTAFLRFCPPDSATQLALLKALSSQDKLHLNLFAKVHLAPEALMFLGEKFLKDVSSIETFKTALGEYWDYQFSENPACTVLVRQALKFVLDHKIGSIPELKKFFNTYHPWDPDSAIEYDMIVTAMVKKTVSPQDMKDVLELVVDLPDQTAAETIRTKMKLLATQ